MLWMQLDTIFYLASGVSAAVMILGLDFLYFVNTSADANSPLLVRGAPLVGWAAWAAGLTLFSMLRLRTVDCGSLSAAPVPGALIPVFVAVAFVFGLALMIAVTGLGIKPDIIGWEMPGTPLLFWQVALVWALGSALFLLFLRKQRLSDRVVFLLLWAIAASLWLAEPMQPTHYALEPAAPTFEFIPYSDAALLVVNSQDLLIGEGFPFPVEKPIYNIFLSAWLVLGQHHYDRVILYQILVLALFPAVAYSISAALNQRLTGIVLAGLLILREQNAIALSNRINVSNSKLIMTDLPAALGVAIFVLALIFWLKRDEQYRNALLLGGVLGVAVLIRSQAIVFLPVMLLYFGVHFRKRWQDTLRVGALFLVGLFAFVLPWMLRNWLVIGEFGYSQPMQATYLDSQYRFDPGDFDLAGAEQGVRVEQGFSNAVDFARQNPLYVARFILTHFLHNEVSALLALPVRFDLSEALLSVLKPLGKVFNWPQSYNVRAYVDSLPFWSFQNRWHGEWPASSWLMLCLNLLILGVGIGVAWRSLGWVGALMLALHFAYSFSTAIARVSGSRFILPVDWILIWLYAMGLAAIARRVWNLPPMKRLSFGRHAPPHEQIATWKMAVTLTGILAAGALIPAIEFLPPQRYPVQEANLLMAKFPIDAGALCDPSGNPLGAGQDVVVQGRALLARFYQADEGYSQGAIWIAHRYFPFSRLGFYVAGPRNINVIFPLDQAPQEFPNAADVIVIGEEAENYILAKAIFVEDNQGEAFVYSSSQIQPCEAIAP